MKPRRAPGRCMNRFNRLYPAWRQSVRPESDTPPDGRDGRRAAVVSLHYQYVRRRKVCTDNGDGEVLYRHDAVSAGIVDRGGSAGITDKHQFVTRRIEAQNLIAIFRRGQIDIEGIQVEGCADQRVVDAS